MLPKKFRLPLRTGVPFLHKKGKAFYTTLFTVIVKGGNPTPRFGFIVSNKTDKHAIKRNRLKRQLRASVWRLLQKQMPKGEFLIIAKKQSLVATTNQIEKTLEKVFKENA